MPHVVPLPLEEQARRVQAPQALGGFSSVEKLFEALAEAESRIKFKRLRSLWRGVERGGRPELSEIAAVCEIPYEFFTVDLNRLPELVEQPAAEATPAGLDEVREEIHLMRARIATLEAEALPPSEPEQPPKAVPRRKQQS